MRDPVPPCTRARPCPTPTFSPVAPGQQLPRRRSRLPPLPSPNLPRHAPLPSSPPPPPPAAGGKSPRLAAPPTSCPRKVVFAKKKKRDRQRSKSSIFFWRLANPHGWFNCIRPSPTQLTDYIKKTTQAISSGKRKHVIVRVAHVSRCGRREVANHRRLPSPLVHDHQNNDPARSDMPSRPSRVAACRLPHPHANWDARDREPIEQSSTGCARAPPGSRGAEPKYSVHRSSAGRRAPWFGLCAFFGGQWPMGVPGT